MPVIQFFAKFAASKSRIAYISDLFDSIEYPVPGEVNK